MADEEPDYSSLPLVDRAVHKLWKVRKEAYEAAAKWVHPFLPSLP
jgi:cytoskeleton-associated protein 5